MTRTLFFSLLDKAKDRLNEALAYKPTELSPPELEILKAKLTKLRDTVNLLHDSMVPPP